MDEREPQESVYGLGLLLKAREAYGSWADVAECCHVTTRQVQNWRREGMPSDKFELLFLKLQRRQSCAPCWHTIEDPVLGPGYLTQQCCHSGRLRTLDTTKCGLHVPQIDDRARYWHQRFEEASRELMKYERQPGDE